MPDSRSESGAWLAMAGALILVAVHVAGKAVRDTLFLSNFEVTDLPKMMIVASAMSLAAAFGVSRFLSNVNPARAVPISMTVSALLLFGEWRLVEVSADLGSIAVYLHLASLSLVLFSGFWSLVNERFDPYSAKSIVPRISGFGALGGVLGGLVAARWAPEVGVETLLPGFAALHLLCAVAVFMLGRPMREASPLAEEEAPEPVSISGIFSNALILRMAVLIAAVEGTEKLIDYAFKASAAEAFPSEAGLVQFFAVFYTASNVLAFVLQTAVGPATLRVLGVGGTLALLPAIVALSSGAAALVHRVATVTLARGAASVLATSFFKASFELLWTPVPPDAKRRAKVFVDVGASGLGELAGGGLVLVLVSWIAGVPTWALLALAAAFSLGVLVLVRQLHGGYVGQLAENLREGTALGWNDDARSAEADQTLVDGRVTVDRAELIARLQEIELAQDRPGRASQGEGSIPGPGARPLAGAVEALESPDSDRIRRALMDYADQAELVPFVIPLLARPAVADDAVTFLCAHGSRVTGQLVDHLVDGEGPALVRRRIPGVLETVPGERALLGLSLGFGDPDFEVELECVRSALRIVETAGLVVERQAALDVVERALAVDDRAWDHRGRRRGQTRDVSALLEADELSHIDRNLELIFTALAATFDRAVMASTLRALYWGDASLRGTALEYLQTILPERIRKPLFARIPGGDAARAVRHRDAELAETLRDSSTSIPRFDPGGGIEREDPDPTSEG